MISDNRAVFLSILTRLSKKGFSIGVGFDANRPIFVHSTYHKDWEDTYVDRGFLLQDPTIIHGQKHRGHFTWAELEALYPGNPVMRSARDFGLTEGNTISLKIDGICTILSCTGGRWTYDEVRQAKAAASALHYLVAPESYPKIFKSAELDVIQLMADGFKDQEIAARLRVKVETIRKRRQSCYEKSGAKSPASLVSFAITNGWL